MSSTDLVDLIILIISGEVAQWLVPRIGSTNREVGSSNLTVSTNECR